MTLKVALLLVSIAAAEAQNSFQNLNFESATLSSSVGGNEVPVTSALPGWSAYIGSVQQTEVLQNASAGSAPSIDILGPNNPSPLGIAPNAPGIIDGHFTVVIQGGAFADGSTESASLQQTGSFPAGDNSLEFKAWASPTTTFSLSVNGSTLLLVILGAGPNYTLYGVHISSYAGTTATLDFLANGQVAPSFLELEDITFSTSSTPEPNPAILTALGGVIFAVFRRKMPSR